MKVIIQEWLIPKHVPVSTLREVNDKKRSNSSFLLWMLCLISGLRTRLLIFPKPKLLFQPAKITVAPRVTFHGFRAANQSY